MDHDEHYASQKCEKNEKFEGAIAPVGYDPEQTLNEVHRTSWREAAGPNDEGHGKHLQIAPPRNGKNCMSTRGMNTRRS